MDQLLLLPWHWVVLGILLLIAEAMGAGGFLIGLAVAAFLQSVITFSFDAMSWDTQLMVFAFNAIVFTVIYWKFFRNFNEKTDSPEINNRAAHLIGRTVKIEEPIVHGEGRVQIGDSLWKIRCEQELPAGTTIRVASTEGMVLFVERL